MYTMKKKRGFLCIIIIVIAIIFCYCIYNLRSEQYGKWKNVDIQHFGTIKLPQKFTLRVDDELYGHVMKDQKTIMVVYPDSKLPDNIVYVKTLESINYSNSATLYRKEYIINGNLTEKLEIQLWNRQHLNFIVMDNSLTKSEVIKIAKSYLMREQ